MKKVFIIFAFIFFMSNSLAQANMLYIYEQENYVNNLQQQMINTSDPSMKIRLNNMVYLAYQLTEQNRALYKCHLNFA